MTVENDLLDGLAQMIATAGFASYAPSGVYSASQTGVYIAVMPAGADGQPAGTDRAITLTTYPISDSPNTNLSTVGVQIKVRGTEDPRDANTLDGQVFDLFHGLTAVDFGTCHLIQMLRRSAIPLGMDSNRRWLRSSNYYADVNTPVGLYRNN